MAKRSRKVAFNEVSISEKRPRDDTDQELGQGSEEKTSGCALNGVKPKIKPCTYVPTESRRFKLKHSLDSDEEDEPDKAGEGGLADEDLAAQEDATLVRQCSIYDVLDDDTLLVLFMYMYIWMWHNILFVIYLWLYF